MSRQGGGSQPLAPPEDSTCSLVFQGVCLLLPYLLEFLFILPIAPRGLIVVVALQLVVLLGVLLNEALNGREARRFSLFVFVYEDVVLHLLVIVFGALFALKFGRTPVGAVVAMVAAFGVLMSIAFRIWYLLRRKKQKRLYSNPPQQRTSQMRTRNNIEEPPQVEPQAMEISKGTISRPTGARPRTAARGRMSNEDIPRLQVEQEPFNPEYEKRPLGGTEVDQVPTAPPVPGTGVPRSNEDQNQQVVEAQVAHGPGYEAHGPGFGAPPPSYEQSFNDAKVPQNYLTKNTSV